MTRFLPRFVVGGWLLLVGSPIFPAVAQSLSSTEARADLDFLHTTLRTLHPGYGFYTPALQLDRLADSLRQSLVADLDYQDFYRKISPLVAALHDGHTTLSHRRGYFSRRTRFLPFYIRTAGPDYFVSHNMSADSTLGAAPSY
jgi:hypothetical protein